ncbi:MAG: PKD domain-containing protein [Pseudomonadota bacterium]
MVSGQAGILGAIGVSPAYAEAANRPPDCSGAHPSVDTLWPANNKMVPVDILGVIDPDGDPVHITIQCIYQDEPISSGKKDAEDATGIGTATAVLRAKRLGAGDGRVYHIYFQASDSSGNASTGHVTVRVDHDQSGRPAVDGGAIYPSTQFNTDCRFAENPAIVKLTNPADRSVIGTTLPHITVEFCTPGGIDPASFTAYINGTDSTGLFNLSGSEADFQVSSPLPEGLNTVIISARDVSGNPVQAISTFTVAPSNHPIRYLFSIQGSDWVFASPGDGTCTGYRNAWDLGIPACEGICALSASGREPNLLYSRCGLQDVFQSPGDGTMDVFMTGARIGTEAGDTILSGHWDGNGVYYYTVAGRPCIYGSGGDFTRTPFLQNTQIGISDTDTIHGLALDTDGGLYFTGPDRLSILYSSGDGSNSLFLSDTDLGVPGSRLSAFSMLQANRPPAVAIIFPVDGSSVKTSTPALTVSFVKTDADIATSTFTAQLNGSDVTRLFTVSAMGASWQVDGGHALPSGQNLLTVTIRDTLGAEASATSRFFVDILRALPQAAPNTGPAPLTVRFTTAGEDPDGSIQLFRWDFNGDGSWDTYDTVAADHTYTYSAPGTFQATLYVKSSTGNSATASVTITVENNPPTATADASPSNGAVPLSVHFTGSGSDTDGSIVLFEWDFDGDGLFDWSSGTTGNTVFTYTEPGSFNAVFRVTDNNGLIATAHPATTIVRTGQPGSPTATASAAPASGNAPLVVTLTAAGSDPDNDIVLYEWDFDGDGTYDWSSPTPGPVQHTYTQAGTHIAALKVTDATGLVGIDQVLITVNLKTSLSLGTDTVGFVNGSVALTTTDVRTTLSAGSEVTLVILNKDGAVVRTLVNNAFREPGTYSDTWDCTDDSGILVNDGVYYAVLYYTVDGKIFSLDLTHTTGGTRFNPPRSSTGGTSGRPALSRPFEDAFLPVTFNLSRAAEVTLFVGILYTSDTRVRTIFNRYPMPRGSHTFYWDGLDDTGAIALPPPGDYLVLGVWGYTLPDNALVMTGQAPSITNVTATPNYFNPFSESCDGTGNDAGVMLTFTLFEPAATVAFKAYSLETGNLVRTDLRHDFPAGANTYLWDGKNDTGEYVDIDDYQIGIIATDAQGNPSLLTYTLVKIDY